MSARLNLLLFNIIVFHFCLIFCHQCGYEACPKPKRDAINIHIVAHTHDDVGWLKTIDQYYYGQKMHVQEAGVQYIIDSVVEALQANPDRRFIYVETSFFWMWWLEQTPEKQQIVRELVDSGRLEIVGGAWSMNDEAAAHYHSIIDQFTWGFRRLNESLGVCGTPRIGWQIDPFGHSRENAALMAKMGFDGLFLGRIDYQDRLNRQFNKALEMLWQTSQNDMSDASQLFTCVMYNTYSPPPGFCFDVHCQDSPIIDNQKSPEYNVPNRIETFLKLMEQYSRVYRSNNVIVTMGNDFNYQYAEMNFKNTDKLIKYINEYEEHGSNYHAFYSSPSCYLKAVNEAGVQLPLKTDDFFPYASDPESFWTGYFTSRPTHKRYERMGNNFLQVGKQILALSNASPSVNVNEAKEAMGVLQHHDAITGTEKQNVASDYARILSSAMDKVENAASLGLNKLVNKDNKWVQPDNPEFSSCFLLNISSCPQTENANSFVVTIYNPLSRHVNKLVRLPVAFTQLNYIVRGPSGNSVPVQMVPLPHFVDIPGRKTNVSVEIAFIANDIPPLGFKSFFVETSKVTQPHFHMSEIIEREESLKVGYEDSLTVSLSPAGRIVSIQQKQSERDVPFDQSFLYYRGAVGNNIVPIGERSSGAYIFRPNGTVIPISDKPTTRIVKGPIVTEVQQKYNSWISQVIRVLPNTEHIEFQWSVGPISFKDENCEIFGKEVITRYTLPGVHTNGIFYTDSNGREMLRRKINYRPGWKLDVTEPIAGNYYPVTTRISINDYSDASKKLSVITDRSEGGSSLNDGQIELMLHRRLLHDDAFGVGEPLNETAFGVPLVAVGSHYITMEEGAAAKKLAQEKVLDAWTFISSAKDFSFEKWKKQFLMEFSGLNRALPDNVQILTLERWLDTNDEKKVYLLRLENIMDKREDATVTKVNIEDLFATFSIVNIKEMMLGGNIPVNKSKRFEWNRPYKRAYDVPYSPDEISAGSNTILLKPMEIRTFLIEVKPLMEFNQAGVRTPHHEALLVNK